MTVRFINDDNIYEQHKLLSDNFSTNTIDWEEYVNMSVVEKNSNNIDTVINGQLKWIIDTYYDNHNGSTHESGSFSCSVKYSKSIYDLLLNEIEEVLPFTLTQISFWKNSIYVGCRTRLGYLLPYDISVTSIDFDTFAINIGKSQVPNYETYFSIKGIKEIKDLYNLQTDI